MTVLASGMYFIEMAFDREVDLPTLSSALGRMGFEGIVFDQSLSEPSTGATLFRSATSAVSAAKPAVALPVSQTISSPVRAPVAPVVQAAQAAMQASPAPVVKLPLSQSVSSPARAPIAPLVQEAVRESAPSGVPVYRMPVSESISSPVRAPLAPLVKEALASPKLPLPKKMPLGGGTTASPSAPPSTPDASSQVSASDPATPSAPEPGQYGGGGGGGGEMGPTEEIQAEQEAMAPPEEPVSEAPVVASQARIKELWQRWVEWGSPFATGPRTSGEREPLIRVRFFATLVQPITLQNRPGMTWLLAHRMRSNPLADLKLQGRPWELHEGKTYEFRFLAREKSAPTRDAVRAGLVAMGFAPMKLLAIKKNMRLPGRAGATLTLWCGVGQWAKTASVVTRDDPFFFEDIREVK